MSAFARVRNHVWPVDPNSEAYRNHGQKHGKREKFRRQPSESVPYKAADASKGGQGNGREGVGRPHQRRAGNYVSGHPFVRLQSATAQVLREADGSFGRRVQTREKAATGHEQRSGKGSRKRENGHGPSMTGKTAEKYWGTKEGGIGRSEYPRHPSLSKCTLGMQPV